MPQYVDRPDSPAQIQETPWTRLLAENKERGEVLYFFSSEQCKFCNDASPWVDAIEEKYKDVGLHVLGVDTNRSQSIAGSAGVTGVPVLIMTQNGEPINRVVGWANDMDKEIELNLGLTDLYGKRPGLRGNNSPPTEAGAVSGETCEGCEKEGNPAIAELAANIATEIDKIKSEIEAIKSELSRKADK